MSTCCTFWVAVVCVALTVTARLIDGFAMPALSEADMRAMVERSKREQPGHCQLHPFNVSVAVEDGMCVGSVPAFGCVGRCETSEAPHYYMSRHEANIPDPWVSSCKCCSHTHKLPISWRVPVRCRNGTTSSTTVIILLPVDCGCTACL